MRENLATLYEAVGDVAGERPAVIQGAVQRSWRELDERASRLARGLADAGRADDYARVVTEGPPLPRAERSGDDEWLMYTGGTTGRPKGVLWRQADLVPHVLTSGYG